MEPNLCANALEFHQFFALTYRYMYLLLQCDYYIVQTLCLPAAIYVISCQTWWYAGKH